MKSLSQRLLLFALLLAVSVGVLWEFFELPSARMRLASLPLIGSSFVGREIGLTDWEKDIFADVQVMKRYYRVGEQVFFVTILDGTNNRHAVHDPFYCFRGGGWELVEKVPVEVPGGHAHILRMEKNGQITETLFWFTDGQTRHASMFRYLWQTTLRRLTLGRSGHEPVRVMLHPVQEKPLDWDEIVAQFPELFAM